MSVRIDLLSLSPEDLELYSNRGNVRRAIKEAEDPTLICEWKEDKEGNLEAYWSDDAHCVLEVGKTLRDARCSCPSGTLCRHIIRTVLAYQKIQSSLRTQTEDKITVWDPGTFSDAEIEAFFSFRDIAEAKKWMERGLLVELHRGTKPLARIHGLGVSVRYLVKNNLAYLRSDCASPLSEQAAIIGILSFRKLDEKLDSGFVVCGTESKSDFTEEYKSIAHLVKNLIDEGLECLNPYWKDELCLLEAQFRNKGYVWLAEILGEIETEFFRYWNHDALFDIATVTELFSELLLRLEALCGKSPEIPERLVAGEGELQNQLLEKRKLIGLGALVVKSGKRTLLRAFMQDQESGTMLCYEKENTLSKDDERQYSNLAQAPVLAGTRFHDFAISNVIVSQAKRSASGYFTPSRKMSVMPQNYGWESLTGNLVLEDFSEPSCSLVSLYPSSLRSRKPGMDFVVLKPVRFEKAFFDPVRHSLFCYLFDNANHRISLVLPYDARAKNGFEICLLLLQSENKLLYVSGVVSQNSYGTEINPAALVFETETGRQVLMPYIADVLDGFDMTVSGQKHDAGTSLDDSPIKKVLSRLLELSSQLFQLGIDACDELTITLWKNLSGDFQTIGFVHFSDFVEDFIGKLEAAVLRNASEEELISSFLRLLVLYRFFQDQIAM